LSSILIATYWKLYGHSALYPLLNGMEWPNTILWISGSKNQLLSWGGRLKVGLICRTLNGDVLRLIARSPTGQRWSSAVRDETGCDVIDDVIVHLIWNETGCSAERRSTCQHQVLALHRAHNALNYTSHYSTDQMRPAMFRNFQACIFSNVQYTPPTRRNCRVASCLRCRRCEHTRRQSWPSLQFPVLTSDDIMMSLLKRL